MIFLMMMGRVFSGMAAAERLATDVPKGAPPDYTQNHKRYQPVFREQITANGYRDLYLFDALGNLVYSVTKADDFASNFAAGSADPLASSGLGEAFRAAAAQTTSDGVAFVDFSPYAPQGGEFLAFLATPLLDDAGALTGVLAISFGAEKQSAVISYRSGLGATGDTIMLGPQGDQLLRLIGREPAPQGIIEAPAMPAAIAALQRAVAEDAAARRGSDADESADESSGRARDTVSLRRRVWPMVEMLKRAHDAGEAIVWGV